jgi:hypothetical protein
MQQEVLFFGMSSKRMTQITESTQASTQGSACCLSCIIGDLGDVSSDKLKDIPYTKLIICKFVSGQKLQPFQMALA